MTIHITGRHIDTGAALRAHVEARLDDAVSKYFEHVVSEIRFDGFFDLFVERRIFYLQTEILTAFLIAKIMLLLS